MFCPLCQAEYRAGFTVCSSCRATLVPGDAEDGELNPPQLAWMTHDRPAFEGVAAQLGEGGIPCREVSQGDHWFYAIARKQATFALFIFERDAEAAKQLSGVEFQAPAPKQEEIALQRCPLCNAEFPAGQGTCPACRADLLAWKAPQETAEGDDSEDEPADEVESEDPPELVWRGGDPVTYSRALAALREAGIMHVPSPNFDHMVFDMAIPRPRQQIRVCRSDWERAHELLREMQDTFPLVPQEPPTAADVEEVSEAPSLASETAEAASAQAMDAQITAEFQRRKSSLRRGLGAYFASVFLFLWVQTKTDFHPTFRGDSEDFRSVALSTLLGVSLVCFLAAYWFLYRAWDRRADKIGFLAAWFAFQGMTLFWLFLALVVSS